jgi:hypothetical protein
VSGASTSSMLAPRATHRCDAEAVARWRCLVANHPRATVHRPQARLAEPPSLIPRQNRQIPSSLSG